MHPLLALPIKVVLCPHVSVHCKPMHEHIIRAHYVTNCGHCGLIGGAFNSKRPDPCT